MKSGSSTWSELLSVWIKTAAGTWTKIFDKPNIPTPITLPYINDYTDLYKVDNVTRIANVGDTITGHRGSWNYSPTSYQYKWQYSNLEDGIYSDFSPAQTSTSHPTPLPTLVAWDKRWVKYAVKATNASGASDWILSSNAAYLIKYAPSNNTISILGNTTPGSTLTASSTWSNTLITTGDQLPDSYSYEWVYGDNSQPAFNNNNSQYYVCSSEDLGHTLVVKITAVNSGGSYTAISNPTSTVSAPLLITNVDFTDAYGNRGRNARGNLTTAALTKLNWTVTGTNTGTTFRVRYRVLNNQTGAYYNPNNPTTAVAAESAWLTYNDDYNDTGNISYVSSSGSTSTLSDTFSIDSTFNGSTYSGGLSRWTWQYEISALNPGGTRVYWLYGTQDTQANDYWDIDPATNPSISTSSANVSTNSSITLSGTFNSYPAALSSYPYAYKLDYGDNTNTGWIILNSTPANQTYSQTKSYSASGTYYPTIYTIPHYTSNSTTVTVNNFVVPTITSVTYNGAGTITVNVANTGGPYYQIYWSTINNPTIGASYDAAGTTRAISDTLTPTAGYSYYFWARSSTQNLGNTTTAGTATAGTYSDWSSYYTIRQIAYDYNGGSGTTTLSFVGDGSLVTLPTPSARTGYTFNGWYTAASGGTFVGGAGISYTASSTLTLYAQWTADTYTVSYDANGGTGAPSSQTKTYNVTLTLSSTTPTRTGYTFTGWNTLSGGGGTSYSAGGSYTSNSALTLYAQWSLNATAPGAVTGLAHTKTYAYQSDLSTTLTRVTSSNKRQDWTYSSKVNYNLTWNATANATGYDISYSSSNSNPGTVAYTSTTNSYSDYWYQSDRNTVTYYYWVRAKNAQGAGPWTAASTGGTSTASTVATWAVTLVNNTSGATSTASPASTLLTYSWTGVTTTALHYARISGTVSGSGTGTVRSTGAV